MENYLNLTSKGGTCVLTAMGDMMENQATITLGMLSMLQKNLQGTIYGSSNPYRDIPRLLSMYKVGKLNLDDMVTGQYRLDQLNEGFQDMRDGRNIRGVIRYTDADR